MKTKWQTKKLGEIIAENKKSTIKSRGNKNGSYPFFISGYNIKTIDKYLIDDKNIFLPTGGTFFVHYFNGKASYSTDTWSIKTVDGVEIRYLYHFLILNEEHIDKKFFKGATIKHLQKKDFRDIEIPLPPLSEQKRIVKILDEAFEKIEKAKENIGKNFKNSKELFESYLQNIFSNYGNDWKEKELGEVCSLYQGIAINAKTKHALVEKSELPLLRIKDLRNNSAEQYIDPNNYPKNALVNESDIIYTRTGNSLGLVFRGRKGVLHNNSFKIVPKPELDKDFLFIWLQNPIFKSKIFSLASKAAQPDITHAIFKIQKIVIPPIKTQKDIIRKLDTLSEKTKKLEAIYEKKLLDLEELKKSVLKRAFNGDL